MRRLYSLILYLLVPLVILRLLLRSRKAPAYRQRWGERFGYFPFFSNKGYLWVHSVSVGETIAAAPLVRSLMARHPDLPLLITTMTPTGSAQVKKLFGDSVAHVYAPYDLPGAVKRFLKKAQPRLAVIMETELWPNLFHYCAKQHVPVIVANARMSERSAQGYERFHSLAAATLANVDLIAAQSDADAVRFIGLGARQEQVQVTGSIKFDLTLPEDLAEQGVALRHELFGIRPVWIVASTHEGEDEQVLQAFAEVRRKVPELLLVLVPRHPERFDRVAELCKAQGYEVVRRSEQRPCSETTAIFVADSMGELLLLLAASDLCFMGGSLVETGGHNLLEPAAVGTPVVFGPHMFNFAAISKLFLERQAARQVRDAGELAEVVAELFADAGQRNQLAEHAKQLMAENRGAQEKLLGLIEQRLRAC